MKYLKLLTLALGVCLMSCGDEEKPVDNSSTDITREVNKGEQLFNNYCLQCHALDKDKIGPPLKGAFSHWDNDTARIRAFIMNAGASIRSGDPRAVQVAQDWNNAMMTPMPHLSNQDVNAILEYIAE
ncbi:MAG: cytochrome c [Chitinophagaceae bacterium]|nr:cytochrome c [Chitinophagaceae bacterium]MCB9047729.1 cytochrome c [Chitinophagales bacterium]